MFSLATRSRGLLLFVVQFTFSFDFAATLCIGGDGPCLNDNPGQEGPEKTENAFIQRQAQVRVLTERRVQASTLQASSHIDVQPQATPYADVSLIGCEEWGCSCQGLIDCGVYDLNGNADTGRQCETNAAPRANPTFPWSCTSRADRGADCHQNPECFARDSYCKRQDHGNDYPGNYVQGVEQDTCPAKSGLDYAGPIYTEPVDSNGVWGGGYNNEAKTFAEDQTFCTTSDSGPDAADLGSSFMSIENWQGGTTPYHCALRGEWHNLNYIIDQRFNEKERGPCPDGFMPLTQTECRAFGSEVAQRKWTNGRTTRFNYYEDVYNSGNDRKFGCVWHRNGQIFWSPHKGRGGDGDSRVICKPAPP